MYQITMTVHCSADWQKIVEFIVNKDYTVYTELSRNDVHCMHLRTLSRRSSFMYTRCDERDYHNIVVFVTWLLYIFHVSFVLKLWLLS